MVAQGYSTRRGRRGALVHLDQVNGRIRGRRGARLTAITSGGAIPENADYRVVLEPEGTVIGTLNEDFAIESSAGDIFQLGNASWRILQVIAGTVRVEDARGEPPTIPFWLGEAPARSDELSGAVADLLAELDTRLADPAGAEAWLRTELGSGDAHAVAAAQIVAYLGEARRLLGALPGRDTLITERFFDEAGGMQLVIHSPFGARLNRAWGLALRKRFCRQFNFELQAAATDEALLLSLGPQHSFPLSDVFRFLQPAGAGSVLVQALLDAPMFGVRWRWNANVSLAVPRNRGGVKVAPQLQRMMAEDLLAAVFPDAAACLENIAGDREVPDHPLARQAIADCLHQVMDIDGLVRLLERIQGDGIRTVARDLPEPSLLAHEILNAKPYAFLDDAPLEERRTQAVLTRRALDPTSAADLGALDQAAIDRVREEAWPDPRDPDEMHDALLLSGWLAESEIESQGAGTWAEFLAALATTGRAGRVAHAGRVFWVATERREEFERATGLAGDAAEAPVALTALLQSRMEVIGPTTAAELADSSGTATTDVDAAFAVLERQGVILRGFFTPGATLLEWCDRRLLARIHRYTLNRLRAEIAPVSAAEFMRFLFAWQRVEPDERVRGLEGLASVIALLDGYQLPAAAWESEVLAARVEDYDPSLLDMLSLTGRVGWGRLSPLAGGNGPEGTEEPVRPGPRPIRATPIGVFLRENVADWRRLAGGSGAGPDTERSDPAERLGANARSVLEVLTRNGASFFPDIAKAGGLLPTQVESALAELAASGLVTSDSFAGLRALLVPAGKRSPIGAPPRWRRRRAGAPPGGLEAAGRWSLLQDGATDQDDDQRIERAARTFLNRYGVVFRRLLTRESLAIPWRKLAQVYRRLEARGEIRGGRFVSGMSGEQFALPEAVERLRAIRRSAATGRLLSISAADPLNLVGIVTPGERVAAVRRNRIVFADGVPLAAQVRGEIHRLGDYPAGRALEVERTLVRRGGVGETGGAADRALKRWESRNGKAN
jgi:ATP-dependent Lhr-like helicase